MTGTGKIGNQVEPSEADYTDFTLCFPTFKYPGSFAFTVSMWNGISE